jgi:hypothetical protein
MRMRIFVLFIFSIGAAAQNPPISVFGGPASSASSLVAGPLQIPPLLASDICGGAPSINSLLIAQEANPAPQINLWGLAGTSLNCLSDPFASVTSGGTVHQGGFVLETNVPLKPPTNVSWLGVTPSSTAGSVIQASSTFRTNYPAVQGGSGSATICIAQGSNALVMGTNASGTCTAGGTGTFTPTGPPSSLVGYVLYICPSGATCTDANSIAVGTINTVSSASAATLDAYVRAPITIPASATGYQYVFVMPLWNPGLRNTGCIGTSAACATQNSALRRVVLDCNDGGSDLHVGYLNIYGQEGTETEDVTAVNCNWSDFEVETSGAQHSGPYRNTRAGQNNLSTTVPMHFWGLSSLWGEGISGGTIIPNTAPTTDLLVENAAADTSLKVTGIHAEHATDAIACGDLVTWPWESGGIGCSNVQFSGNNGNANITNVIHFVNSAGSPSSGDSVVGTARNGATCGILDGIHSATCVTTMPPVYAIGSATFADGITLGSTPLTAANGGTGTGTAPSSAQLPLGNVGGTAYAPQSMTQDCTITNAGVITCTKTNNVPFGTFATQNYATPPAIGGTTPAAGSFTTIAGIPSSDSTSVVTVTSHTSGTADFQIDTTNHRVGVGGAGTAPAATFDVGGGKFEVSSNGNCAEIDGFAAASPGCAPIITNTASGTLSGLVGATTLVGSVAATHWYVLNWQVVQVAAGTSCTGNTTFVVNIIVEDPNAAATSTVALIPIGTTSSTITIPTVGTAGAQLATGQYTWAQKSGVTPQYSVTGYSAGSACSPAPTFAFNPVVTLVK